MNPWQALVEQPAPAARAALWGGADLADRMRALHPLYLAHDAEVRSRLSLSAAPLPSGAGGNVMAEARAAVRYRLELDKLEPELRAYVVQWDELLAGERVFYLQVTFPVPTGVSLTGMDIAAQFEVDLAAMRRRWQELQPGAAPPIPLGRLENPAPQEAGVLAGGAELLKWGAIFAAVVLGFQALNKGGK